MQSSENADFAWLRCCSDARVKHKGDVPGCCFPQSGTIFPPSFSVADGAGFAAMFPHG
jgi:hypothetical protein